MSKSYCDIPYDQWTEEQQLNHRINCKCDNPILVDERTEDMGFMCCKCGKNADTRVLEYVKKLGTK